MPKNGGCCSKNVYKISIEGGKEKEEKLNYPRIANWVFFWYSSKDCRNCSLTELGTSKNYVGGVIYREIPFFTETKSDNINTLLIIILEDKGIQSSISHKGNSPDNGMMESFLAFWSLRYFMVIRRRFSHLINWNKLLWTTLITTITNELKSN